MSLSIRGRLTLWYGLVLLAVLIGAGGSILVLPGRLGLADVDRELANRAATVLAELQEELEDGETLEETVEEIDELELPETGVAVADADGAILAVQGLGATDPPASELVAPVSEVTLETPAGAIRLYPQDLESAGYVLRVVVWTSLADFERERDVLIRALLLGVPLAMLVALVGGWSISRRALGPLGDMADQTRTISDRRPDIRLHTPNSDDELGVLASAFNALLDRLAGALKLQRRFMTDASHELRTPVSVVRTTAQVMLGRDDHPKAEYREALTIVAEQAQRLSRMVDDMLMLMLAVADAGGRPLQISQFYLDELVHECVRSAQALGQPHGVQVNVTSPDEVAFSGDEELLKQMLFNLLGNGVRHAASTAGPAWIDLTVETPGREVRIVIDDTGPGIAEADRERVFERFVRIDAAGSTTGGGLGLPIARWVAEAHGGSVTADASPDGGGRFVVVLPISQSSQ